MKFFSIVLMSWYVAQVSWTYVFKWPVHLKWKWDIMFGQWKRLIILMENNIEAQICRKMFIPLSSVLQDLNRIMIYVLHIFLKKCLQLSILFHLNCTNIDFLLQNYNRNAALKSIFSPQNYESHVLIQDVTFIQKNFKNQVLFLRKEWQL